MLSILQEAFGNSSWSKAQVFRRHNNAFKNGRDIDDEESTGCPSNSRTSGNVAKIKVLLNSDYQTFVRLIVKTSDIKKLIVDQIVPEEIQSGKFVSR